MLEPMSADLLLTNARHIATVDDERREIAGGWVAITDGLISALGGSAEPVPGATRTLDVENCLVTPGLINAHHHLFQNLTRAYTPMTSAPLFGWLQALYPLWTANLDEEAEYTAAWVGLAELALSGCTTSSDHHYLHPVRAGDLLGAEIAAAQDLGMRFYPTYGSMSLSEKDGGLPPDDAVRNEDDILAESERHVARWHDPSHGSMVQIALAPCSPFTVTPDLMRRTAELAERLDVRLHTHLAENSEDDEFAVATFGMRPVDLFEDVGWLTDRTWGAHVVRPNPDEVVRLGAAGVGVAHCPSSNMILSSGIAPVIDMRHAGCSVGLGCDGSSSADSASLWQEARLAMLQGKLVSGADAMTARIALEVATRGGAGCLGREGELGQLAVGAVADVAVWRLDGPIFAGVLDDPVEGWLRCGPTSAWHTIINGTLVVEDGHVVSPKLTEMLAQHQTIARRFQPSA
ncbi:MAG: 8-oxoguanine deaminase [Acidimicrobiales bacterium]|nr:8-oxoguanine deaminase [Acidimicrobiales bacterium]RZV45286.1 MAG: 8-oxoguanine deaminase [Acidimicrobiales bacterium]